MKLEGEAEKEARRIYTAGRVARCAGEGENRNERRERGEGEGEG